MKRRLQFFSLAGVSLLMCALFLVSATIHPRATSVNENSLDFGIAGMESNQIVLPSVLWKEIVGEEPTAVEKDYLDGVSGISFVYNSAIPDSIVETEYNGDTGTLAVSLPAYSFTATNGTLVEWIPIGAKVEENVQAFSFSEGKYSCSFSGLFHSGDFEIEIDFEWKATLSADAVDTLLTAPYIAAEDALEVLTAYEAELAVYNAAKAEYLAYEAYLQSVKDYEQYINIDLPAYEAAVEAYKPYLAYLERLQLYKDWQQYWAYQEFMTGDMQAKYQAYQAYLKELEPIQARLKILDTLFVKDSHGWQLYGSLMGGTVEQVLSRKDELITYKEAFRNHINNAEQSTKVLKTLMKTYSDLSKAKYSSEYERLSTLYGFYVENYSALKDNFSKLFDALNYMGSDSMVITALSGEGKLEHYYQFVGQLYITQACLDDSETLLSNYPICGQLLSDVVESNQFLTDATASPTGVSMPATEVPKVEKIEQIDKPAGEEVQYEPTLADFGLTAIPPEPQEPDEVKEPVPVDPADDPGNAPPAPEMDTRLHAIAEALRAGSLQKREPLGKAQTLTFTETVHSPVSISNLKTVTFYAADGKTVLDRQTLEYGTPVVYRGPDTARESDAQYHYVFLAWVLSDGTAPEMVATSNLSLYAHYQKTPRFYTVTWTLDGQTETRSVQYGTVPVSPFLTQKSPDVGYTYTFSGWDKEVTAVTGDVSYTGSFIRTPRMYTVTWVLGDRTEQVSLPYGTLPVYEGDTARGADSCKYVFDGWDKPIVSLASDVTYTARYIKTPLATDNSGNVLSAEHSEDALTILATVNRVKIREAAKWALEQEKQLVIKWNAFSLTLEGAALQSLTDSYCSEIGITKTEIDEKGTVYTVGYLNSVGVPQDVEITATLQALVGAGGGQLIGYVLNGDEWNRMEDNRAAVTGTVTLRISDVYEIKVISQEPCNLSRLPRFFEAGADVDLSLIGCVFGYEISSAAFVTADGTRTPIEGMLFQMPKEDVQVELTITKIIYNVSFVVDGEVIYTASYGMGEEILLPEDPAKATDEFFSYTFKGWSPEVGIAFGDERNMVFEAVFTSVSLGNNTVIPDRSLFFKTLTIAICVFVLVVGALTFTIIFVRKKKVKKALKVVSDSLAEQTEDFATIAEESVACALSTDLIEKAPEEASEEYVETKKD